MLRNKEECLELTGRKGKLRQLQQKICLLLQLECDEKPSAGVLTRQQCPPDVHTLTCTHLRQAQARPNPAQRGEETRPHYPIHWKSSQQLIALGEESQRPLVRVLPLISPLPYLCGSPHTHEYVGSKIGLDRWGEKCLESWMGKEEGWIWEELLEGSEYD